MTSVIEKSMTDNYEKVSAKLNEVFTTEHKTMSNDVKNKLNSVNEKI